MKTLKKRLIAALTAVIMLTSVAAGAAPVRAAEAADARSKYVDLEGSWNFKLYRTYANMYQYFAFSAEISQGKWTDAEAAVYPADGAWKSWETVRLPDDNPETGGLLTNDLFPTWSEAWAVREFELPADFTEDSYVTLLLGIVDDNDVVYINGQPVAASGFVDGNGDPVHPDAFPAAGGFVYQLPAQSAGGRESAASVQFEPNPEAVPEEAEAVEEPSEAAPEKAPVPEEAKEAEEPSDAAPEETPVPEEAEEVKEPSDAAPEETPVPEEVEEAKEPSDTTPEEIPEAVLEETPEAEADEAVPFSNAELVKWETSYWEVEREYRIPASVLKEGTNEIAVRIYNNNSFGGFYSGHIYALCGNEQAVRNLKGLPTQTVDSSEILAAVAAQNKALAEVDLDAYAATIAENYHNDAAVKADRVAEMQALLDANGNLTVTDSNAAVYEDDESNLWYSATRTVSGSNGVIPSASGDVEICFAVSGGTALERGNWNRCYGDRYHSDLFGKDLTYSVYLPPSYYEDPYAEYPTVWLLHGRGSSSTSYRNVDDIGGFMDAQIQAGNIMEMVLIMPDSGKTAFYRDSKLTNDTDGTGPWHTQLVTELREVAESKYRLIADPAYRGLSGNSMGAYGSIMAGLTHPELYSSIGLHMGYLPSDALETLEGVSLETLANYDFYMDAGKQDTTVGTAGTVAIHEYLESVGKDHGYSIRDGGHNSAFYMAGMPASMKMHSDHFQAAMEAADLTKKYVDLEGDWHFKLYRTYANMYQYFAFSTEMSLGNWTDADAAVYPENGAWKSWQTVSLPDDNPETGGLLTNDLFPSWAEAWAVREFELPADFTEDEYVTLLMGIVDDNDVVYINGQPVASSGFVDGNGNPINPGTFPATGGFVYEVSAPSGGAEEQVKWETSYWSVEREYSIPASVLKEGTNEIAVRIYNNNNFGGFYSGHIYALCGSEQAVRNLKGLPTQMVKAPEILAAIAAQNKALAENDLDAYAATIAENYHNDAAVKADRVAEMQALLDANGNLTVTDSKAAVYRDAKNNLWYSATRTVSGSNGVIPSASGDVEICFAVSGGKALERGNWNRCYGDRYSSELFGKDLTYSVYLPPNYYEDSSAEYPTVWLLHGRGSSSTSYRNVDDIGGFMDAQIQAGNIMEMVLIMPDSGKTAFYRDSELTNDTDGTGPWHTQLVTELREVAESKYRLMADSAYRGLSGNSMGAYGSIMAGLTHPELYSSIGLHMGYLPGEALETLKGVSLETLANYDFYMDAGKQDTTVGTAGTVAIHEYLESVGKDHGYSIRDGGHNSAFYMAGMAASMKMHSDHFQAAMEGRVTVFFDANGGTASASSMRTEKGKLSALPTASRTGYNFNGWYTAASGGEKVDLNRVYTTATTLYARWTIIPSGGGGGGGGSSRPGTSTTKPGTAKPDTTTPSTDNNHQSTPVFTDVPETFWAKAEIAWASENGIMNGMGGDRFAPSNTVSRQQLWMVLGRLAGDSPADMAAACAWAKENGISDGTRPGENVSRQQLVAMLYRYAKEQGYDTGATADISTYPDNGTVANYAKEALAWAIANGILNGTSDGRLNPEGTATRAQFAAIMYRFDQKFGT